MAETVLYDIPSGSSPPQSWGPNTWKARMSLNFKGIPYTTHWLEYPDIAPFLRDSGLPPNASAATAYTCPAVKFADGTMVMDSLAVAQELDRRHPDPPLHSEDPMVGQVMSIFGRMFPVLAPAILPQVPRKLLSPESSQFFEQTRAQRFGMTLTELEQSKGADAFEKARPIILELVSLLKQNTGGPFFLGASPSFADFVVAGLVEFLRRLNTDTLRLFLAHGQCFEDLHTACKAWLERDS